MAFVRALKKLSPHVKSIDFFLFFYFFHRLDAVGDIDLPYDGRQPGDTPLYADACPGVKLSISHRLWPPVVLLERRQRQFRPLVPSKYR